MSKDEKSTWTNPDVILHFRDADWKERLEYKHSVNEGEKKYTYWIDVYDITLEGRNVSGSVAITKERTEPSGGLTLRVQDLSFIQEGVLFLDDIAGYKAGLQMKANRQGVILPTHTLDTLFEPFEREIVRMYRNARRLRGGGI